MMWFQHQQCLKQQLLKYEELKDKIKVMRIAILGNYATQFLQKPLIKKLKNIFDEVNCYHAEFNSIDFEFIDDNGIPYKCKYVTL